MISLAAPRRLATASLIAVAVRAPMPGHQGDLVDVGRPQLLERPEVLEQRLATDLAEAGHVVEQIAEVPGIGVRTATAIKEAVARAAATAARLEPGDTSVNTATGEIEED